MANRKYIYLTEGECEEKLVMALKERPSLIVPGKVRKFNVVQDVLPVNMLMQFDPGSMVVLIFDTDKEETEILKNNIRLLKSLSSRVAILTIAQVLNFEDEIERDTDVDKAQDFTKSTSVSEFKSAVNKMKSIEFRRALNRHKLDMSRLWIKMPPQAFCFIKQDSEKIKENRL